MREAQADICSRTVHGLYYLCVWADCTRKYYMHATMGLSQISRFCGYSQSFLHEI